MTYPEAIQYLESFINYEDIAAWPYKKSLKLERFRGFLASIHNPQDALRCIHVAGTKGKGSTCAFIAYILKQAGLKVGLYTSPHLIDFRERIRVLKQRTENREQRTGGDFEGIISKTELTELVTNLRPAIQKYNSHSEYGPLSLFEVYTALAFIYFKEQNVDCAVLETGLGGRLDATNVVRPLVCAITPISYEHTDKLGNTLRKITREKAGIIKAQNLIVISAPQEKEAMEVIRDKCQQVGARLYEVGKDIRYVKTEEGFRVKGVIGEYSGLKIKLIGHHQLINASVAIGVVEALKRDDVNIGVDSIRLGFYNTLWPGRCEVISRNPLVILDGAQNVASAKVIKKAVRDNFKYKKLILMLGISSDKDIKGICKEFYGLPDAIILTKANSPRASRPQDLAKYFKDKNIYISNNVEEAKALAFQIANREDLILVTGSLFVVGEFRDGRMQS